MNRLQTRPIKPVTLLKIAFIFLFITALAQAKLSGNTFSDDSFNFEITVPGNWKINTTGVKKRVLLLSGDDASEVGIDVVPLNKPLDGHEFALSQFNNYDSWEYVAGRYLGFFEKHGADNGFCVMYNKSVFGSSGREKKIIVQEYYFIKSGKAYVVSLLTDSEHWNNDKSSLLDALNSFRIY